MRRRASGRPLLWLAALAALLLCGGQQDAAAQYLAPDLLASVPITPLTVPPASVCSSFAAHDVTTWRGALFFLDKGGRRVAWARDSSPSQIAGAIDLPPDTGALIGLDRPCETNEVFGLTKSTDATDLVTFALRGDGKGGYQINAPEYQSVPLLNPDGSRWCSGRIQSFTFSPDGSRFWAVVNGDSGTHVTAGMWKFDVRRTGRRAVAAVAVETLPFPQLPLAGHYEARALAWWSAGLLVALDVDEAPPAGGRATPHVALVLLPWGGGEAPRVLIPRLARRYRVLDMADTPHTLYVLLQHGDTPSKQAIAAIPKLYPTAQ
jgi:hypothetical protein